MTDRIAMGAGLNATTSVRRYVAKREQSEVNHLHSLKSRMTTLVYFQFDEETLMHEFTILGTGLATVSQALAATIATTASAANTRFSQLTFFPKYLVFCACFMCS